MKIKYKLTFVGYGKHAKKIELELSKSLKFSEIIIYHPKKKIFYEKKIYRASNNFDEILDSDIIVISSPNKTHFQYLNKLHKCNYKNYIFCEKPLCTDKSQFLKLKKIIKNFNKIYVNFNYRHSIISTFIEKIIKDYNYGKPMHISFINSHGLAMKKEFSKSWRNSNNKNFLLLNKSIHIIDLLIYFFGIPKLHNYSTHTFSNMKSFKDTLKINLIFKNNMHVEIFCSYACPFIFKFEMINTNSYLEFNNKNIKLFYPRNNFGRNKNFIFPKINKSVVLKRSFDQDSLSKSINFFCNTVSKNKIFSKNNIDTYLNSHSFIFSLF